MTTTIGPASAIAPDSLRAVLGSVPTGVMVITTRTAGGHEARTANSFASVSLEPPLVSVCFGSASPFTAALCAAGSWGASVLADDQRELSARFSRWQTARDLAGVPHTIGRH